MERDAAYKRIEQTKRWTVKELRAFIADLASTNPRLNYGQDFKPPLIKTRKEILDLEIKDMSMVAKFRADSELKWLVWIQTNKEHPHRCNSPLYGRSLKHLAEQLVTYMGE